MGQNDLGLNPLLERARAGDAEAENDIFEKLSVRYRLLARRYLGGQNAEDVVQEACSTVLAKYRTEEFHKSFEAWCQGVLKMTILSFRQKQARQSKREVALVSDPPGRQDNPGDPRLKEALLACLKKLLKKSRTYARVLNLTYQGFGTDEICSRLSITSNNYYVSLNRGRQQLKHCIEQRGFTP